LLFSLCKSVWLINRLSLFLLPSQSSNTPFYPQSVASQGACFDSLLFCCFHFRLSFESIKELGTTSTQICKTIPWEDWMVLFCCCVSLARHGGIWLMVVNNGPMLDFAFFSLNSKNKESWKSFFLKKLLKELDSCSSSYDF
jgi:hypothetical protein